MIELKPIVDALGSRFGLDSFNAATLAGIVPGKTIRRVSYCRFGAAGKGVAKFVAIMTGDIDSGVLERLATQSNGTVLHDKIGAEPILGRGGLWIARRGNGVGAELVLANARDLLGIGLFGPAGSYPLDAEAPLSLAIEPSTLADRMPHGTDSRSADFEMDFKTVQSVTISLAPRLDAMTVQFVAKNEAVSQRLAESLRPFVETLSQRLASRESSSMSSVEALDGNVVARLALPAGSIDRLISQLSRSGGRGQM